MKIALVGCGRIAQTHASLLKKQLPGAALSFCDRNQDKAEKFAAQFSSVSAAYTDYSSLLDSEHPDAVHILTQPASHVGLATAAMEAGAHVYVEKPVTTTLVELDTLHALAERTQKILYSGYSTLGYPVLARAKSIIESGKMGGLVSVHCDFNVAPPVGTIPYGRADHWAYFLKGGILENVVDHPMSILVDTLDDVNIHDVCIRKRAELPEESPNLMHATVCNRNQVGSFTLSYANGNASAAVAYFLEAGTIRVDLRNFTLTAVYGAGPQSFPKRITTGLKTTAALGFGTVGMVVSRLLGRTAIHPGIGGLIANFYTVIEKGGSALVSQTTARNIVRLLEGIWDRPANHLND